MKRQELNRSVSGIAALLMLAVFGLGILGVLLGGARIYKDLTACGSDSYDSRTCLQYLRTKLNQSPDPSQICVEPFGEQEGLFIRQTLNGQTYVTRIYCHNGWLMELFSVNSDGFAPEDGEKILPLDSLSASQSGSLLTLKAYSGDALWTLHHSIRGYGHEK